MVVVEGQVNAAHRSGADANERRKLLGERNGTHHKNRNKLILVVGKNRRRIVAHGQIYKKLVVVERGRKIAHAVGGLVAVFDGKRAKNLLKGLQLRQAAVVNAPVGQRKTQKRIERYFVGVFAVVGRKKRPNQHVLRGRIVPAHFKFGVEFYLLVVVFPVLGVVELPFVEPRPDLVNVGLKLVENGRGVVAVDARKSGFERHERHLKIATSHGALGLERAVFL